MEYVCEDCGRGRERRGWQYAGSSPRVCKRCQNKRYLAKIGPEGRERLKERKRLRARVSGLRKRIRLAEDDLQSVEARLAAL